MFPLANLAQLIIIFDWMLYAQVVPAVMRDLHLSYWQAGLPVTVLLLVMAVMQFAGGMLADRLPEPLLSFAALAFALAAGATAAVAHSLAPLVWSRAFNGVASGLSFIAGMRLASRLYIGRPLSLAMGVFGSMVNVGILLSAVTGPWLERALGWRGAFWLGAAVTGAVMVLYLVRGPRALRPSWDKRSRGDGNGSRSLRSDARRLVEPAVWVAGLCHTASFGILLALSSWFPALLTGGAHLGAAAAGRVMGLFALVGVVGRLSGPAAAARLGPRGHTALSLTGLALALLAVAAAAGRSSSWLLAGLVLLIGWMANYPFSTLQAGAAARDPEHAGAILGALNFIALGVAMTLPIGFGWLKDLTQSFHASVLFFAAVAAAGVGLSWFLPAAAGPPQGIAPLTLPPGG